MKFGAIISVHDSRAENPLKINETRKIPAFPDPERNKFGPHPFYMQPRTSDLAKSEQKDTNFSTFQKMYSMTPARKSQNSKHEVFFHSFIPFAPIAYTKIHFVLLEPFNSHSVKCIQ